jgi:hypothetical protein
VKTGALAAFGGDAPVWKDFIENKLRLLLAKPEWLTLTDDNFIRELLKRSPTRRTCRASQACAVASSSTETSTTPRNGERGRTRSTDDFPIGARLKTTGVCDR